MISGLDYNKEDGIQLAIGGGNWYLFYDRSEGFFKKHHWNEKRIVNGILYWRNFGRVVFIKDVPIKYRTCWDNPKRIVERDDKGNLKRLTVMHT